MKKRRGIQQALLLRFIFNFFNRKERKGKTAEGRDSLRVLYG